MVGKHIETKQFIRLDARTRAIQGASRLAMIACAISLGFVVVATAFPQKRQLDKLQIKLAQAKLHEQEVLAERDFRRIELKALREDPEYLEIHARDRLGYCRAGERVLRVKKDR